jgi:hypothetical protein
MAVVADFVVFELEIPVVKKTGSAAVEVEDLSIPALRAVDSGRAELQRELLERLPELRLKYEVAMAAVREAEKLVEDGERAPAFLAKRVQAARSIADAMDKIRNDHPRRLRELCTDTNLRREEHRLRVARNRAQEAVSGLRTTVDHERVRLRRVIEAASADFGVKGQDWEWSAETGFEVLRPGAGRSGLHRSQLDQIRREHQTALTRAAEELALVESDLADATRAWEETKAGYERNRSERTWSVH